MKRRLQLWVNCVGGYTGAKESNCFASEGQFSGLLNSVATRLLVGNTLVPVPFILTGTYRVASAGPCQGEGVR